MDQILHLDTSKFVKKILFEQFYIAKTEQNCKNILYGNDHKLIANVCHYYVALLEHAYIDGNGYPLPAVYSPYTLSWISSDVNDTIGQALQNFVPKQKYMHCVPLLVFMEHEY